ncbi:MAG: MMPL family transporter [Planctomycetales bacterium]|nr:MMPL family transporter [Planctomycetales bacterium]
MNRPSFLARKTFGLSNYFLLAMAAAFLIAFMPRGVRRAVESNTNKAEDWLPASYEESKDLKWFRQYFVGEQFALVSWDGCTLGNTEKLDLLARKLVPSSETLALEDENSPTKQRSKWYSRVLTGPAVIEELTAPPLELSHAETLRRLEGALVGQPAHDAAGKKLGDDTRVTCLIVFLTPEATSNNKTMRAAVEMIRDTAVNECGIPIETFHMGGPPVDNITIDVEGEKTLMRLASLAGLVGVSLAYWCLRSVKLTAIVFAVGVISAGMSLAVVYYFGGFEIFVLGQAKPRLGTVDAILMSMPAVVYVLGLSGAIHTVNYYRDARRDHGLDGAAERAVKMGWWPCTLAAFTTAVGLGSLYTSDILPIKKFGMFTAIAVMGTVAILFTILPVFLHRFPITEALLRKQGGDRDGDQHLPNWAKNLFGFILRRHNAVFAGWMIMMAVVGYGMTKIETSVQLLKLLDQDADLIHDYAWLETHLGNLVPMEVVLTMPPERRREDDEHAEADGKQYRLTMTERADLIRRIQTRIEALPEISRALSLGTFLPKTSGSSYHLADTVLDYITNNTLRDNRSHLLAGDYLRMERVKGSETQLTGRELWRISARVAALEDSRGNGIDYGKFVHELQAEVDPVLLAYEQRDELVRDLHDVGKQLAGGRLIVLYRGETADAKLDDDSPEGILASLLRASEGVRAVSAYNVATFENPGQGSAEKDAQYRAAAINAFQDFDAVVAIDTVDSALLKEASDQGVQVAQLASVPLAEGPGVVSASEPIYDNEHPRPIRAVFTGMVPLVYKTQAELLVSLRDSIAWATVLIAGVMMFVLRNPVAGLASMIPNVFPIAMVFGALGWLGIKVDIGIMMTASVALGVAVDDTIHYLTWFRRGISRGHSRYEAAELAYDRCGTAMLQTTIIGGLGLSVFATSTFTPTQQFGYLMITMLGAALVGDLLLLPAILVGPLGRFFGGENGVAEAEDVADGYVNEPAPAERAAATVADPQKVAESAPSAAESTDRRDPVAPASVPELPEQPAPEFQRELLDGPHAALHAKLRNLRRDAARDSAAGS